MTVVIPENFKEKEYPVEQYVQDVINRGVAMALERNESYPMPDWFREMYGESKWHDCIATALDSYGIKNPPPGNETFAKDYEKYGFRKLNEDEQLQRGDIIQWLGHRNNPFHALMVTDFNEKNEPLFSYSNGSGVYIKNRKYGDILPRYAYRFVGRKEDIDDIDNYNTGIERKRQASMSVEKLEPQSKGFDVKPLDTVKYLEKLAKKHNHGKTN